MISDEFYQILFLTTKVKAHLTQVLDYGQNLTPTVLSRSLSTIDNSTSVAAFGNVHVYQGFYSSIILVMYYFIEIRFLNNDLAFEPKVLPSADLKIIDQIIVCFFLFNTSDLHIK